MPVENESRRKFLKIASGVGVGTFAVVVGDILDPFGFELPNTNMLKVECQVIEGESIPEKYMSPSVAEIQGVERKVPHTQTYEKVTNFPGQENTREAVKGEIAGVSVVQQEGKLKAVKLEIPRDFFKDSQTFDLSVLIGEQVSGDILPLEWVAELLNSSDEGVLSLFVGTDRGLAEQHSNYFLAVGEEKLSHIRLAGSIDITTLSQSPFEEDNGRLRPIQTSAAKSVININELDIPLDALEPNPEETPNETQEV